MFPIRDHNPSRRTPYVTYALLISNVAVFLSYVTLLGDAPALYAFFERWALIPADVADGRNLTGIFSSMFLHGGWMHLIGNMLFLWIFGDNLEDTFGHFGFTLFYLACGIAAALAQVAINSSSIVPMVGASGAIAGIMGGYLLLFPKARIDILFFFVIFIRIVPISAWIVLCLWFMLQLIPGAIDTSAAGGVAYWAHIGGFVAGFLLCLPVWFKRGAFAYWSKIDGHPPHPDATYPFATSRVPKVPRKED